MWCYIAGRAKNVTLYLQRLVHPSDVHPTYGLRETNNKVKRFGKYSAFSIKVKGAEVKGAERHQNTPQQGCARYQVLGICTCIGVPASIGYGLISFGLV